MAAVDERGQHSANNVMERHLSPFIHSDMILHVRNVSEKVIERADRICVVVHGLAWISAAVTWGVKWHRDGPAPSGPLYNGALHFISRLDILVRANIEELTIKISQAASDWFSADIGASIVVTYGFMLLLAGTLQWFLLGRLVQWLSARKGRRFALAVLCVYAVWVMSSLFLWVAA